MNTFGSNSDPADWLLSTVRKNPEGLLLLGAGLALLMRAGGRAAQSRPAASMSPGASMNPGGGGSQGPYGPYGMSGTSQAAADSMQHGAEQLRSAASNAAESMSRGIEQAQSQAQTALNTALQSGQRMVNSATESGQRVMSSAVQSGQQVVNSIAAQPLLVAVMGISTGLALASLLPESAIEHRALQDAGRTLADTARDAGSRVAAATGEVGDKLAEEAANRGLNKEGVQDLAGTLTDTFKNALADKTGDKGAGDPEPARQATPGSQFS